MGTDSDLIDYATLTQTMKRLLNLLVCKWATETTGAFGGAKWACKRDRSDSDLCKTPSTDPSACRTAIQKILNCKSDKAWAVYSELKEFSWIKESSCERVFFLR